MAHWGPVTTPPYKHLYVQTVIGRGVNRLQSCVWCGSLAVLAVVRGGKQGFLEPRAPNNRAALSPATAGFGDGACFVEGWDG